MKAQEGNPTASLRNNRWVKRLWGMLPLLSLILLVGVIVVLQSWIDSQGETIKERRAKELAGEKPPVNVVALALKPGPIREQISLPGTVQPWVELKVVAEVRGKIVTKKVTEGQKVNSGQVLAEIDQRDYQNAYNSAHAAWHAARATHERIAALYKDQLATQSQMDDALAALETSQAAMDTAALNLERCTIRSPMEGVVDKVYIEKGQFMNDTDPLADILQIDRVKVVVSIPESDVDAVRHVEDFNVRIDALGGRTYKGHRHYLAKSAQTLARSYQLEVAIDNFQGEILPDMFARVEILKHQIDNGLAVPLFSLINQKGSQGVYLAENGHARLVQVKTGIQEGWQVQVVQGLASGDQVIVVGHRDVKDGAPVQVLRTVEDPKELER
jgi:membrane fusion protein (multidrug efflux system)